MHLTMIACDHGWLSWECQCRHVGQGVKMTDIFCVGRHVADVLPDMSATWCFFMLGKGFKRQTILVLDMSFPDIRHVGLYQ